MPSSPKIMLDMLWSHPANRGLGKFESLAKAAAWQVYKRTAKTPRTITVYDGLRFRAYPHSTQPGRFLYFGGLPDYEEMTFMRRYLRPGDGFIDGGANEGMFTLLAAELVGATGEVHAFEAVPLYVDRLRDNVALNGLSQVTVHPVAVGETAGEVSFVVRGTGSRIQTVEDKGETITVPAVTLDEALPDRLWAMGKLDLEGAEHSALRGAERLLKENPPAVWMIEVADRFLVRFGTSERGLRDWLGDHGYDLVLYDPESNDFRTAQDPLWPLMDLMAVHRSRADEVTSRLQQG